MDLEIHGGVTVIDSDDYPLVKDFRWYKTRTGYAVGYRSKQAFPMHRVILGLTKGDGLQVDHIDGDGLNNRRSNLRVCTQSQNRKNRKVGKSNDVGHRGIWRERGKYRAVVWADGQRVYLGYYDTLQKASTAYQLASYLFHGEFASSPERLVR